MICWECGAPLALDKENREIFQEYTDPIGNVHKLHKVCFKSCYAEKLPGIPPIFSEDELAELTSLDTEK